MPGPELPPDLVRTVADLRKRVAALEKRRPHQVFNLDDLDDTEVLYASPADAPADGDALVWEANPDVAKFGGLWKPGWPAMYRYGYSTGYVESGTLVDLTDYGPALPQGVYLASISCQANIPTDCCGWWATAGVSGAPGYGGPYIGDSDWHAVGLREGVWTGSTGDSGTYGWQAPQSPMPGINATGIALVPVMTGEPINAMGTVSAWVLDDPGTSDTHFGAKTASQVLDLDVTLSVYLARIAPL